MKISDANCYRNVITAVTWRILAELFRRQHRRCDLRILELHPCGGTYDCISLYAPSGDDPFGQNLFHMNVPVGSLHFFGKWGVARPHPLALEARFDYVKQYLAHEKPAQLIDAIEARLGLPIAPEKLPPTTPPVLTLRVIAGLAEKFTTDPRALDVRCAWNDDGWGARIREWVRVVPGMETAFALQDWRDQMRRVSKVWRLEVPETARAIVFDIGAGRAYSPSDSLALMDSYRNEGRKLEPLVQRLLEWL